MAPTLVGRFGMYADFAIVALFVFVYMSLSGLPLRPGAKLFIGWFGPRGLASIVFGILVLEANLPGGGTLAMTVVCTIVLSILLHGLSANPLAAALGGTSKHREGVG